MQWLEVVMAGVTYCHLQVTGCVPAAVHQVISTSGDTHLGGEDFDQRVMEYFIKLIKRK